MEYCPIEGLNRELAECMSCDQKYGDVCWFTPAHRRPRPHAVAMDLICEGKEHPCPLAEETEVVIGDLKAAMFGQ